MRNLQVAGHIRHQSQSHGGVIILDTAAGQWIALNPTAGEFWRIWGAGASFECGVAEVTARYPEVASETIRTDAALLLRELVSLGLITAQPGDANDGAEVAMAEDTAEPGPGKLRVAASVIALAIASVLVRSSFQATLSLVRLSKRVWCRRSPTPRQAADTVAAVSQAARIYPGRAACLEQSLAAVLLAAASRRRLDWCLGSATDPYRFHAWVEISGSPVCPIGEISPHAGYSRILVA